MVTKNIVPRTGSQGEIGTLAKPWDKAHIDEITSSIGVSASYFYGDGSGLTGVLTSNPTLAQVLAAGNTTATPITGSGLRIDSIGNTTLDIEASLTALNLSGATQVNIDVGSGGSIKLEGGTVSVGSNPSPQDFLHKGNFTNYFTASFQTLSASNGISGSSFQGDGSGLTGVTGDWDGQHTGDAGITGSLDVTQDLTVTEITASGILSSSAQVYVPKINLNNDDTANYINYNNGFFYKGNGHFYGNLTSSVISASSGFVGDGSGLTGVTGDWDGQLNGDAGITGSLDVSGSTTLGSLVTDTHIITGSTEVYVEAQTGLQVLQNVASSGYPVARFENTNAGGSTYVETHGTNQGGIKMYRGGVVRASIDTGGNAFCMYNGTPIPANLGFMIASGKAEFKETTADNFTGTKAKLNVSASSGPAIRIDSGATGNETTFKVEDYTTTMVSASADLLTMDDTSTPPIPTNAAHLYAITGSMYVQDTSGTETKISPHDEYGEWEYFSRNTKTGKVTRIRMEKMIRKLEELTGETFIEEE